MSDSQEILDIVDKDDRVIGQASRQEIHNKALLHRSVNMLLFRNREIFLQKRSKDKKSFPSIWDLSCAEHVLSGETYQEAAVRGFWEELGIKVTVERIREVHSQDNSYFIEGNKVVDIELVELYKTEYLGEIKLDPVEVMEGIFLSIPDIKKMVRKNSSQFTPWFLDEWKFLSKYLITPD